MALHKRVLSRDPQAGTTEYFYYDDVTDQFHVQTEQDDTQVAELNHELRKEHDERANWKGDTHRVASIPMVVYADLVAKGITRDRKAFSRWLNDPDNRVFRTRPGRV